MGLVKLKDEKNIITLIFNENLDIRGERKIIDMGRINGFGRGSISQKTIHPACSVLVKQEGNSYTAINFEDQRLSSFLDKYKKSTKIEVVVIDIDDIEKISFITKELIPQISAPISFNTFFKNTIKNTQHQIWVRDYFSIGSNKKNSALKFNTKSFSECFGSNTPSLSTLNKIKENSYEDTIRTIPIQTKKKNPITDKSLDIELNNKATTDYNHDHLREIWNNKIGSKYSYDYAVRIASNKNSNNFIERLHEGLDNYNPEISKSKEFAKNLELFLDKESTNEP